MSIPSVPAVGEPLATGPVELDGEFECDTMRLIGEQTRVGAGSGRVTRVLAERVDLAAARWEPVELVDTRLRGVELSNTTLRRVIARRVAFDECRGIGLAFDAERATDVCWSGCRLDYARLHVERCTGPLVFDGCSLREAVVSGDLSRAVFTDCDLTDTEFAATTASGCDLRGSRLDTARGLTTLRGAVVSVDQVVAAATRIATAAGFDVRE